MSRRALNVITFDRWPSRDGYDWSNQEQVAKDKEELRRWMIFQAEEVFMPAGYTRARIAEVLGISMNTYAELRKRYGLFKRV